MKPLNNFQKTVLVNGLTVISETVRSVRSVSVGVWIKHGSRSENENEKGLAHFIEHLVFKGTAKRNNFEIANSLEKRGGALNAYTSKEATVFYAHVLDEHLEIAVDVLSDIASNPLFDASEIEREREVVMEEINSTYDVPEEICHDAFLENLFPKHSLGWPILGDKKSLRRFDRNMIHQFWQNRFDAKNVLIVASGNVEHQDLVKMSNQYFNLPLWSRPVDWQPLNGKQTRGQIIYTRTTQAHICMGTRSYPYDSDQKYPLAALSTYLGGGMSSALFQQVREKNGLAYSVYSFLDFYKDVGNFGIYLATDINKKEKAIALIKSEIDKLLHHGIPDEALADIRSQLKGELLLGLESTARRMSRLAKMEIYLELDETIEDIINKIEALSSKQVSEAARELFGSEMTRVEVLPEKK